MGNCNHQGSNAENLDMVNVAQTRVQSIRILVVRTVFPAELWPIFSETPRTYATDVLKRQFARRGFESSEREILGGSTRGH